MVKTRNGPKAEPLKISLAPRKHKSFDEDADLEGEVGVDEDVVPRILKQSANVDNDDAPEVVVHAISDDIKQLQEMHNSLTASYSRKKKKRPNPSVNQAPATTAAAIAEAELGADVLAIFEKSSVVEAQESSEVDHPAGNTASAQGIDKHSRKSRKMYVVSSSL